MTEDYKIAKRACTLLQGGEHYEPGLGWLKKAQREHGRDDTPLALGLARLIGRIENTELAQTHGVGVYRLGIEVEMWHLFTIIANEEARDPLKVACGCGCGRDMLIDPFTTRQAIITTNYLPGHYRG